MNRLTPLAMALALAIYGASAGAASSNFSNFTAASASVAGGESQQVGQIQVANFANPGGLQAGSDNFLFETGASGPAQLGVAGEDGRGHVKQGMLEGSNVSIVEELVDMIECQRAYEINSKMISSVDEMLRNANQTL